MLSTIFDSPGYAYDSMMMMIIAFKVCLGPGRPIRLGQVHSHMCNPSETSGNTVAMWLVKELAGCHDMASKNSWLAYV